MIYPKCKKAHKNITIFGVGIALMIGVIACSIGKDSETEVDIQATVDAAVAATEQAKADMQATIDTSVNATRQAETGKPTDTPLSEPTHTPISVPVPPTDTPTPAASTPGQPSASPGPSNIAQVWANEGGDKVTRDELRAMNDPNAVVSLVWDGTDISLFGARNEVVAFNLVLEAPTDVLACQGGRP